MATGAICPRSIFDHCKKKIVSFSFFVLCCYFEYFVLLVGLFQFLKTNCLVLKWAHTISWATGPVVPSITASSRDQKHNLNCSLFRAIDKLQPKKSEVDRASLVY